MNVRGKRKIGRRFLAVVLSVCMLLTVQPNLWDGVMVQAEEVASGTCGTGVSYTLDEKGMLTITGTGKMDDYTDQSTPPWYENRLKIYLVKIESGVTSIGNSAFNGCSSLVGVTIEDSVTSIGDYAFYNCSSLMSVEIPNGVTSIGKSAFYKCSSLMSVEIPNGVTSIGESTFRYCSKLESVKIPNGVGSIGQYAFQMCKSLKAVTIQSSVTSIGNGAFNGCSSLTSVTIPDSVTSIGKAAFASCSGLTSVEILSNVTSLESSVFSSCSSLTKVTIPDSVTSIGDGAFNGCSGLTSIRIPSKVTSIGDSVFYNCSGLTEVTIPSNVKSIGQSAFFKCSKLTSVEIPDSVTSIGNNAFNSCTGLTSVEIPMRVTSIGNGVFSRCSSLSSVTIPSGVTSIGNGAFNGCSSLTSMTIPNSVTSIGESAFASCSQLAAVTMECKMPPDLKTKVFDGCPCAAGNTKGIYVPAGTVEAYRSKTNWSTYEKYISDIHNWSTDWTTSDTHHWHKCNVSDCVITNAADNDGYGEHVYDDGSDTTCNTCGYIRTLDTTPPTGTIAIENNSWTSLLDAITFGVFFKETKQVTVTAEDTDSGVDKVYYYISNSDSAMTENEVKALEANAWTQGNSFSIDPDKKCVIYAKITDKAGNVTYLSSDGLVFDATPPVITGVTNGGTYHTPQTVTVTDAMSGVKSVTVNGTEVTLTDNQFTLGKAENSQTIVATDKAGNTATVTLTVKNGTIAYTAQGYEGTYDGQPHGITVTVTTPDDADITYSTDEGDNKTYDAEKPVFTKAGTYTVYYKIVKENYDTVTGSQKVIITPKAVTITANDQSIPWGNTVAATKDNVSADSLVEGDTVSAVTLTQSGTALTENGTISIDSVVIKNAAGDDVTGSYNITKKTGTLKITHNTELAPDRIEATKTKTAYAAGDTLNVDDLTVTAYYEDGYSGTVSGYTTNAEDINMSTAGVKTLTVSYTEKNVIRKAELAIVILPAGGSVDDDGNITVPAGGSIQTEGGETITLPDGGSIDKDGNVEAGKITVGDTTVTAPDGGKVTVNKDGTITISAGGSVQTADGEPITLPTGGTADKDGNVEAGKITVGNTTTIAPSGKTVTADKDGNITVPEGGSVQIADDELITLSDGGIVDKNGNVEAGKITVGDTTVTAPSEKMVTADKDGNITVPAGGSVQTADGEKITLPAGGSIDKDEKITIPAGGSVQTADGESITLPAGGIADKDGNVEAGKITVGNTTATAPDGGKVTVDKDGTITISAGGSVQTEGGEKITLPAGGTADKDGNVEAGKITIGDTTVTAPDGEKVTSDKDGTITIPAGGSVQTEGGEKITLPDGGSIDKDGNVEAGKITVGNTTATAPDGEKVTSDKNGNITVPDGGTVQTGDGAAITLPEGGSVDKDGNVEAGKITVGETTVTAPEGGKVTADKAGTITVPAGGTVQTGDGAAITLPEGGTVDTAGTIEAGKITVGETTITAPEGGKVTADKAGIITVPAEGTVETGDGKELTLPNGGTVDKDENIEAEKITSGETTVTAPEGGKVTADKAGTITVPAGGKVETGDGKELTLPNGGTVDTDGNVEAVKTDAEKVEAAESAVKEALAGITATNGTTKEDIQSVINTALTKAEISDVTVTVGDFSKTEATTSAAGSISGTVTIKCGTETDSVVINKSIGKLPEDTKQPEATKVPEDSMITPQQREKNNLAIMAGMKVSQTGKKISISWGKIKEADGYQVYVSYCGKKFTAKPAKTVKSASVTKVSVKKINGKKLNLKRNYKVYIAAYTIVNGKEEVIGKTLPCHIVGKNNATYTNAKQIKLTKSKFTLKAGKTAKIKAKVVLVDKKKKPLSNAHAKQFRYATSNKTVATVSKAGKIKAVGKGSCTIYVYARNGYAKKITVKVK